MKRVLTLDCTLRDGGYCNNWKFGHQNIVKVINGLVESGVDYIECGYVSSFAKADNDSTKYSDFRQLNNIISTIRTSTKYLVMINYGEISIEQIPKKNETVVDGIRVAFHKKDLDKAIEFCEEIKNKGYEVFVQPMVTMCYSDVEFNRLIEGVNGFNPTALYIVDSFGMMKQMDILHYARLSKEMNPGIMLGLHAHNNMQLAFANSQCFSELELARCIVIDVAIHGMGRGAGNLNAELFLDYLNSIIDEKYNIKALLNVMDEVISGFFEKKPWGYSLPNYLSAVYMSHPNYAYYLSNKRTLTLEAMDEIFGLINPNKRYEYDEKYIEQLYIDYLSRKKGKELFANVIKNSIGKDILLIAPGSSAYEEKEKINSFIRDNSPMVISINFYYPYASIDYIFVSNMRRFRQLNDSLYSKTIVTSNIKANGVFATVDYESLLNSIDMVRDNACLMAMKLFADNYLSSIYIAGLDGYSHSNCDYAFENLTIPNNSLGLSLEKINKGIAKFMSEFSEKHNICFLTSSIFAN